MEANQLSLLIAMVTSSGAIWAISFVTYSFIFNYLERWAREKLTQNPNWIPNKLDRKRLRSNLFVFIGFVVVGVLAFATIVSSALTIAYDKPEGAALAYTLYGITIGTFLVLFANEIRTSVQSVLGIMRKK